MIRKISLRCSYWSESKTWGWIPEDAGPMYYPLDWPPGIAHDCLDHLNGFQKMEDEFIAHGVLYYLNRNNRFDIMDIADEFPEFIYKYTELQLCPMEAPKTTEVFEFREDLDVMFEKGRLLCSEADIVEDDLVKALFENYPGWFMHGYNRAKELYGKLGRDLWKDVFDEIADFFRKNKAVEGGQVDVEINTDNGDVTFSLSCVCMDCLAKTKLDTIEEYFICEECNESCCEV